MKITNCILVNLSIGHWDANGQDVQVSNEIAAEKKVTEKKMCRLRKSLIPPATPALQVLMSCIREARKFHYENTHAWMNEGPRILTRGNYDFYMQKILMMKSEFSTNVLEFCEQYPNIKEKAKSALGSLYREEDYPSPGSILARYYFRVIPQPMPAAETLTEFGLDKEVEGTIRADLESSVADTFRAANEKMWSDLELKLFKLKDKLSNEGAYVMDGTIENVRKLANLYPRVNLTGDTDLDNFCYKLTDCLNGVSATKLQISPSLRARIATETASLYDSMHKLRAGTTPAVGIILPASAAVAA